MTEKEKIELIMEKEQLNSIQFASEIGIQSSTLSHILNGRNNPSLDVLKKILNRFRTINSDWLILGVGSMYRNSSQSQAPTLFDIQSESVSKTDSYVQKNEDKTPTLFDTNQQKTETVVNLPVVNVIETKTVAPVADVPLRSVKKIIIYYSDNTFQEFAG